MRTTIEVQGARENNLRNVSVEIPRDKLIVVTLERDYYDADDDVFAKEEVTTSSDGTARATFANLRQGWYRIRATTTDDRGRTVTVRRYIWVIDPRTRQGYVHTAEGSHAARDGVLRAHNPNLSLPLASLFG